jgi:hypothetical protein
MHIKVVKNNAWCIPYKIPYKFVESVQMDMVFIFKDVIIVILIDKCSLIYEVPKLRSKLTSKNTNIIFCNKCYQEILKKTSQNPHEQNPN